MKYLTLTIAALSAIGSAAIAHPGHDHGHKAEHAKTTKTALVCPVTGTKIASVKASAGHSTYKGKTYFFCCPDCKPKFDKDPAKTVKDAAAHKYQKM